MNLGLSLSLYTFCLAAELSIGVAPINVLGLSSEEAAELRQIAIAAVTSQRQGRRLVTPEMVDNAISAFNLNDEELRVCLQNWTCASRIAQRAQADQLLTGSVAGLGTNFILRLRLIDARHPDDIRETQQTVMGTFPDLSETMTEQVKELFPRDERPWYFSWWFWTTIGIVVAAAAIIPPVVLSREEDQPPPTDDIYPFP